MKYYPIKDQAPPEGEFVFTKINDGKSDRNFAELKKQGRLWFGRDGLYVYYEPTHWAPITVKCPDHLLDAFDRHYFNW